MTLKITLKNQSNAEILENKLSVMLKFSVIIRTLFFNNNSRHISVIITENYSVVIFYKAFQCGLSVVGLFSVIFTIATYLHNIAEKDVDLVVVGPRNSSKRLLVSVNLKMK